MDFYEHVRPQEFEHNVRNKLVEQLRDMIKGSFPDAEVCPFGSFMSGLYLPTGDMDIVICSRGFLRGGPPTLNFRKQLFKFRALLERRNLAEEGTIQLILHAKVPLVKYVDRRTGLRVDISFERYDGVRAISTFLEWKRQYPAMPILVTVIKQFLAMRGLNEPVSGGIGGFSVICLVVSMLQLMPQVQSRSMKPEHHLGEILMEFFDLYGRSFNYEQVAIRMNPPGYVPKVGLPNPHISRCRFLLMIHSQRSTRSCTRIKIGSRLLIRTTRTTTSLEVLATAR